MRILIISNYFPPFEIGGWEQNAYDIAQLLTQRGHQVHIVTSNYKADHLSQPEPGVERLLYLESSDHVHYHLSYALWHRWHEQQNATYLKRVIGHFIPDIIFIWGMWNLPVTVAQQAEELLPNRVVYSIASYWPMEESAHLAYWRAPTNRSWKRWAKNSLGWIVRNLWLHCPPRNQLEFEHVLCVSDFMKERLHKEAGLSPNKVKVVHNGIDLDAFIYYEPQAVVRPLRLLYAGRLSPDKGVHTAIKGFAHYLENMRDSKVTLSIVGSGAPSYKETLKRQVVDLQISHAVHFYDQVQREQMPTILAEHDVLLFPSIWPEPLARMTQEAMACGLVVIGTDTGGTPELLQDGHNGFIFTAGDAQMLGKKIAQAAANPKLRRDMADAARRTIEQHFTLERMADEIEIYLTAVVTQCEEQKLVPA